MAESLRRYLDSHQARYEVHEHEPRFTSQETAKVSRISGKHFAKAVLLRVRDGRASCGLAVLPASETVDLDRLSDLIGHPVEIADEEELVRVFPGFDAGAAPPIPELAKERVPVYVDACLAREGRIAFNAGTHTAVVEMAWKEYERLTTPRIVDYGRVEPT